MTRTTHIPTGRLARTLYLALPVMALACGGDDSVSEAEARTVTPVTRVAHTTRPTEMAIHTLGGEVPKPPTDAQGFYAFGVTNWKAGKFDEAKAAFDKVIELDPQYLKAYLDGARVLLALKRVPEAVEMIEKARAIDSTSAEVWRLTARAKEEGGDEDGALQVYRDLLVRNELDAWGLNNLGMLMRQRGEVQAAIGPLARAVQVRPTSPLFLNNLGMALEDAGYKVAALRRYDLAVTHDSTFVKAVRNGERLRPEVVDSALGDEVDVKELADQFRMLIKTWKPIGPSM